MATEQREQPPLALRDYDDVDRRTRDASLRYGSAVSAELTLTGNSSSGSVIVSPCDERSSDSSLMVDVIY